MKPLDYTLYNKVKEKFPPQPLTVIFVSLKPENLNELHAQTFKAEDTRALRTLIHEHAKEAIPFATIGSFSANEAAYRFYSREFEQEENLSSNKITKSSIGTYHNNPIDIGAVKRDLQKFGSGISLSGNA